MNALAYEYDQCTTGAWAEMNPRKCPCRGGWFLSDLDTWHRCPVHGAGCAHPEDEDAPADPKWMVTQNRKAYATFRDIAARSGMTSLAFKLEVVRQAASLAPGDMVDAAEEVAHRARYAAETDAAIADGYGSRLEARWAEEAEREAQERAEYYR